MYYAAVDPIVLAGEKRAAPKAEAYPVTEATPQFRDFTIKNVTCLGAEKAIFIRGLPEMNIRNVNFENITITAKSGIELTEATGIRLKGVRVFTTDKDALIKINNAGNVLLDDISYGGNSRLFSITGKGSKGIRVQNTLKAKEPSTFSDGATETSLITE
jgi:hypothetical protein